MLRFAHHFVKSKNLPLIFKRIGAGAALEAWVDSSHQAPGGRCGSPGGGLIRLGDGVENSAPLLVICSTPRKTHASSAASELEQVARIIKAPDCASTSATSSDVTFAAGSEPAIFLPRLQSRGHTSTVTWAYKYSHVSKKQAVRRSLT